jgi:hypothetical protein
MTQNVNEALLNKLVTLIAEVEATVQTRMENGEAADSHTMWLSGHRDAYWHLFNLVKTGEVA